MFHSEPFTWYLVRTWNVCMYCCRFLRLGLKDRITVGPLWSWCFMWFHLCQTLVKVRKERLAAVARRAVNPLVAVTSCTCCSVAIFCKRKGTFFPPSQGNRMFDQFSQKRPTAVKVTCICRHARWLRVFNKSAHKTSTLKMQRLYRWEENLSQ